MDMLNDGTRLAGANLETFVDVYCHSKGMRRDLDLLAVLFAGKRSYSAGEARAMLDAAFLHPLYQERGK